MKIGLMVIIILAVIIAVGYFFFGSEKFQSTDNYDDNENIVYETEVDGPNDCGSYEKYDAERKVCSYECADEAQCKEIGDKIDNELAAWTDELKKDKEPVQEKTISEDDPSLEADYNVSSGEHITLVKGKDSELNQNIWKQIAELSPDTLSDKYIEEYQVFDNASDDTLAFVDDEDQNGKWRVAVNLSGYKTSTAKENKATFIHELFHIISLNSAQVVPGEGSCNNFKLDEGCANTNSYINTFKNTFWKRVSKQDYEEGKFVTEYAATNEVEDLAESFAFFVLGKDNSELGNKESEQKMKFFYQYPELVSLRSAMRNVIGKDIVRARVAQ
jgi:nitrogen fixation-related uncharacterized protein